MEIEDIRARAEQNELAQEHNERDLQETKSS
jgi:hypothetical protein